MVKTPLRASFRTVVSIACCALGTALAAITGCLAPDDAALPESTEEAAGEPVGAAEQEATKLFEAPGPEDVAGVLRTDEQRLYVYAQEVGPVLAALEAIPFGNNQYITPWGDIFDIFWAAPDPVCSCNGYTIYRNAQCGGTISGGCGSCFGVSGGQSERTCTYARTVCRRGTGYCVNRDYAVIGQRTRYDGAGCGGVIAWTTDVYGPSCQ